MRMLVVPRKFWEGSFEEAMRNSYLKKVRSDPAECREEYSRQREQRARGLCDGGERGESEDLKGGQCALHEDRASGNSGVPTLRTYCEELGG